MKKDIASDLEKVLAEVAGEFRVSVEEVRVYSRDAYLHSKTMPVARGCRDKMIESLRQLDYTNQEIADGLTLSCAVVAQTACRLINSGKINRRQRGRRRLSKMERAQREERVIELSKQGRSRQEISEALGLSVATIDFIFRKLLKEGRVKSWSDVRGVRQEEQVRSLVKEGLTAQEISDALDVSPATFRTILMRLGLWGAFKGIPGPKGICDWHKLDDPGTQKIIAMRKQGRILQDIGDAIGITRERARQLIARITAKHGKEAFASEERLWTTLEAADELKTTVGTIRNICAAGEVPCRRRSARRQGSWLIDEAGMEVLRRHPLVTKERTCTICRGTFVSRAGAITCSEECAKRQAREWQMRCLSQEPSLQSLQGWHKNLWQRLQSHRIPEDEEWLTLMEARRRTGLSQMQMVWLRLRKIVTIRDHPTRTARGKPIALYAASEMDIARQVYAEWKKKEAKKKKKKAKRAK